MSKARSRGIGIKQAAEELGVSVKWIRRQVAAGRVAPTREGTKKNSRFLFTPENIAALRVLHQTPAEEEASPASLARIGQLEADRANLLAQVAWARAIAQQQGKELEAERARATEFAAEIEKQRQRVEALKALSAFDRVLGRHKAI